MAPQIKLSFGGSGNEAAHSVVAMAILPFAQEQVLLEASEDSVLAGDQIARSARCAYQGILITGLIAAHDRQPLRSGACLTIAFYYARAGGVGDCLTEMTFMRCMGNFRYILRKEFIGFGQVYYSVFEEDSEAPWLHIRPGFTFIVFPICDINQQQSRTMGPD